MITTTSPSLNSASEQREKELFKIQQERETTYSKSSKRERELFKIQQEREGGIQNPAREREKELLKIRQEASVVVPKQKQASRAGTLDGQGRAA